MLERLKRVQLKAVAADFREHCIWMKPIKRKINQLVELLSTTLSSLLSDTYDKLQSGGQHTTTELYSIFSQSWIDFFKC